MFQVYTALMSAKLFHSSDLDGLKEALTDSKPEVPQHDRK